MPALLQDEDQALQLIEQVLRQDVRGIKQGRLDDSRSTSSYQFYANLDSLRIDFTTSNEEVRGQDQLVPQLARKQLNLSIPNYL